MSAENNHRDEAAEAIDERPAGDETPTGEPGAAPDSTVGAPEIPLTVRLEEAEARAAEYLDGLQRERAAFQNYRKRTERERGEQSRLVVGNLLLKLLPTLDDFYRAMEAVPAGARDEWFEGVMLIQRKLERFLEDEGVTEIPALGQPFDPQLHEAVGVDPDATAESGTITEVVQRGYRLGDRVLRPALVRVAG